MEYVPSQYNPVVWFEIYVDDLARARRFYEAVLQQTTSDLPCPPGAGLQMAGFAGGGQKFGANGALVKMEGIKPGMGGTLVYFTSEDCAVELGRVEAVGGKVFKPKFSIGEYGHAALAIDTEGNMFGLHSMK